ncbi:Peptidase-S8 domain-containing protein [Fusarium falciforme]|uniref:Peptidase-S8 domain-containing protein n=1 Tax=Fusarium falciforme TaxID=195108 RepID=UPI002301E9A3|nr:Peptidase-S8 domain-containing protein [Fusarium falciforme]WAO91652.1 Peptidase-S8 domain-containing protein [Fusarium falciforme]
MEFVMNGGRRVGGFISNLDKFASIESPGSIPRRPGILSGTVSNELIESPDEYPATVNTLLKTKRSIRFAQDVDKDEYKHLTQAEKHTIIQLGRFCALLGRPIGSVCIPLKIVDGHLCELDNPALPDQQVAKAGSVSLSDVLEKHRLPSKVKIALAYTLAKAVWRYYNSDFMRTPWTTESVHFMREDRRNISQDEINPANPCFAFRPFVPEEPEPAEYCDFRHVYHRYPRVLALGVLLVAIVENQVPRSHPEGSSTEERMNDDLMTCRDIAKGKDWPNLGLQSEEASLIYRDAVDKCLDPDLFHVPSSNGDEDQAGIRQRRNALYTHVVLPLEGLCEDCGIIDKQDIGRLIYSRPVQPKIPPTPTFLATPSQHINHSQAWIQNLAESFVSKNIVKQYRLDSSLSRVRIAILDTGYDSKTQFFQPPSRKKRIVHWKDFTGRQDEHVDCDGHGTHVLSLAMKIAPGAEICVARVANSANDLTHSASRIADAIKWATDPLQGNADIVSMSFGFPEEPYVEGRPAISNAIHRAMHDRDGRVLFFAATANDGANQTEMFPARHPNVISIRATDHKGAFQEFNPAADYSGAHVFGTLGTDVPGAGLSTHDGEVYETGVSMATPIAAGIAAMVLMDVRLGHLLGQFGPELLIEKLWKKNGMDSVLRKLSRQVREKHYYIYPHDFFRGEKRDTERNALIIDALRLS